MTLFITFELHVIMAMNRCVFMKNILIQLYITQIDSNILILELYDDSAEFSVLFQTKFDVRYIPVKFNF